MKSQIRPLINRVLDYIIEKYHVSDKDNTLYFDLLHLFLEKVAALTVLTTTNIHGKQFETVESVAKNMGNLLTKFIIDRYENEELKTLRDSDENTIK